MSWWERREDLEAEHHPDAIRSRLERRGNHSYLGDAVLGAIDGCVTTFAVVAGAAGGGFSASVAVVLGFSSLLADGFSMAVSNYQGTRSQQELVDKARRTEERHIEKVPEGEREEVRQIFARKGFKGEVLEEIVETITQDRKLWVDTMLTEELELLLDGPGPLRAALTTFGAFLAVGLIPLLPFLIRGLSLSQMLLISAGATAAAFFGIGIVKGRVVHRPLFTSGLSTLVTGSCAAALAYFVAWWLRHTYGIN